MRDSPGTSVRFRGTDWNQRMAKPLSFLELVWYHGWLCFSFAFAVDKSHHLSPSSHSTLHHQFGRDIYWVPDKLPSHLQFGVLVTTMPVSSTGKTDTVTSHLVPLLP